MTDSLRPASRRSAVELLKLIAVVMIVFSHSMPWTNSVPTGHMMNLGLATQSKQRLAIVFYQYGGQLGNAFFVVSSAWFLIGSHRVRLSKVLSIMADTFLVSVLFLAGFLLFGYPLDGQTIAEQFTPLLHNANWYIVCYLMFYCIHPALNWILEKLDRRALGALSVILIVLYGCIGPVFSAFYYNRFLCFLSAFFPVAYIKLYLPEAVRARKTCLLLHLAGWAVLIAGILGVNALGLHMEFFSDKVTLGNTFNNPVLLLIAMTALLLSLEFGFTCKAVNYLSGLSMLIYIIHGNRLVMDHLRQDYFRYIYQTYGYRQQFFWVTGFALALLVFGVVLAMVYRHTLQRPVHWLCGRITAWIGKKWQQGGK